MLYWYAYLRAKINFYYICIKYDASLRKLHMSYMHHGILELDNKKLRFSSLKIVK